MSGEVLLDRGGERQRTAGTYGDVMPTLPLVLDGVYPFTHELARGQRRLRGCCKGDFT